MASHACSTSASAADAFQASLLRSRRRWLEDWIERAIEALDRIDGDPDAEDGHDTEAVNEDGDPAIEWPDAAEIAAITRGGAHVLAA